MDYIYHGHRDNGLDMLYVKRYADGIDRICNNVVCNMMVMMEMV